MSGLFTSLAVMMSPRGLAAAGEGAGLGGVAFVAMLALAAVASLFTARGMESLGSGKVRATGFDHFAFGLFDSARLFTLTLLAVSWLGIAGYAVNEIYFLWFPNLGASFFLLGFAVLSCIMADENGADVFGICLTLAFCAFIYVAVMSMQPADSSAGYPTAIPPVFPLAVPEGLMASGGLGWLHIAFLAVFVFLGFDLPLAFENKAGKAVPAILLALAAFLVFVWSALLLAPSEKLADTSVPHLLVARLGLGELGRHLMGGTVVLGTIAGLLAFFKLAGKRMETILVEEYRPHAPKTAAVLSAVVIGALLGTGWAGEDALESLISAGLCFWFGTYALVDLLYMIGIKRSGKGSLGLLLGLVVLGIHSAAAAFCAMHVEFRLHFYYSLAGMGVAGVVFGIDYYLKNRPDPSEVAEFDAEGEEDGRDVDELVPDAEDEALNIVDYK